MADGPRCKRRKQANPKRSSVTNFNNGPEASSDSDDEDKLHIVEEESQEEKSHKKNKPVLAHNGDCNGVKDDCGSEDGDDGDDGDEDEEEEEATEADEEEEVQQILQQEDTAVIYPEAPEENPAETGGADENGTPDDTPPLHMCPYCSRGYKRNASLKEHIKYRHETSDDNYSCSHCSYTFTYRSQLERHMSHHRGSKEQRSQAKVKPQRQSSGGSATRKFKCNVCTKAFKYKHHLKEHLRIHSGEKPYECANCHKRFSHSGSYSSHITSKKCAAAHFPNGLNHPPLKPQQVASMSAALALAAARKEAKMDSKPLQEQIPLTQIKTEPVEEDIKPAIVAPVNGVSRSATGTTLPQGVAMVVPTMGLMSPIGINISGLQNVFGKVLTSGAQGKQGFVVQQPQQQIISLPAFVDHDGTTKIIINYSLSPAAATTASSQPGSLLVKSGASVASAGIPIIAAAPIPSRTEQSCAGEVQDAPTDLSISKVVKEEEPDCVPISDDLGIVISKTESVAEMPKGNECLLCEECPEHLEAVHLLQHRKAANGEAVDSAALDPSFADLLSEAGVTLHEPSPSEDVLSLLKRAFASCARPGEPELRRIAESVRIPAEVVRKWFEKTSRKEAFDSTEEFTTDDDEEEEEDEEMEAQQSEGTRESKGDSPVNLKLNKGSDSPRKSKPQKKTRLLEKTSELQKSLESQEKSNSQANLELHNYSKPSESSEENAESQSTSKDLKVVIKTEPYDPEAPDSQAEPLDLSLPKSASPEPAETPEETNTTTPEKTTTTTITTTSSMPANMVVQQSVLQNLTRLETTPLNLACINKDQLEPRALYVTTPQSGNSNFVTATQIPTLVAIAGQGTVGCLSAINPTTKQRTILIPQLTYTYTPAAAAASKGVVLNGVKTEKKERLVGAQKTAPPAGSLGNDQKKIKMDQGIYACDICCKVFQKGSSLLRHKYEHTGRRPHECLVCKKAFKHKHHLIEHARLHTGIKPYQCDKCGKRFSHSGSYSQHMNHRYSYCKRNAFSSNASSSASNASSPAPPETTATPPTPMTAIAAAALEFSPGPEETPSDEEEYEEAAEYEEEGEEEPAMYEEEEDAAEYEEEEEEEDAAEYEEYEEEAMCVEDIRVVQIDDSEDRQDGEQYEEYEEREESGEEMEVELGEGSDDEWEDDGGGGGRGGGGGMDFRERSRRMTVRAK